MKKVITKKIKLHEVNNDMTHNYYYGVYFRLYSDDGKRYKRGHFVVWFDSYDIQEYLDKDSYTQKDVTEYASELGYSTLEDVTDYNNTTAFYNYCNKTIDHYNNSQRFF